MPDPRLAPLTTDPSTTGLFLDFDGTLSEIVLVPSEARPRPGVPQLLRDLDARFGCVSVISGRSALQLVDWLGPEIEIWGVHGAEHSVDGEVRLTEHAVPFEELMERVRIEAERRILELDLPGVVVEDKRVMIGLHFRAAADVESARDALDKLAADLAERHGLLRAGGRLAFELRPPREFSKAAVVLERARDLALTAALFAGDDRVDLPAFDALDVLAEEGVQTLRVAVDSDEAPEELLERADLVVDGPDGAVALLRDLLP
jgi:trehalose 6-phosphate phosphatase